MNLANMLKKAKPISVPIRFSYGAVIKVWIMRDKISRAEYSFDLTEDLDSVSYDLVFNNLKDKVVKQVLKESQCFNIVDVSFITNFATDRHYNWFIYDTCFSSVKLKAKIQFSIQIWKVPHVSESVELNRGYGNFHTFYSIIEDHSRELRKKYELGVQSKWSNIL